MQRPHTNNSEAGLAGRNLGIAGLAIFLVLVTSACRTTKPWKRGTLAKTTMSPDGDASREALRHHMLSTREGAVGGFGGGGGGCGCN